jgi:DNA-binding transcriptional LysR family regulator
MCAEARTSGHLPVAMLQNYKKTTCNVPACGNEVIKRNLSFVAISDIPDALSERIDRWRLFEERFMILAAADADLRHHGAIPFGTLADAVWIERIGCPVWQRFRTDHFPDAQQPKVVHRGHQESHLQHMVAAGFGIMIASEHTPCLPSLIARPLSGDTVWREVHVLVVSGRHRSPAPDAFIKTLRDRGWKSEMRAGTISLASMSTLLNPA